MFEGDRTAGLPPGENKMDMCSNFIHKVSFNYKPEGEVV